MMMFTADAQQRSRKEQRWQLRWQQHFLEEAAEE